MSKISVIIPCYNVEHMVTRCLESIVSQSIGYENLEIILIDDASTDDTVVVLEEWERKYPDNILLIKCEKNGKQGTARNVGLLYATGDYISFVDSDDKIHKKMYEILLKIIEESNSDIVQFRYKGILENHEDEQFNEIDYDIYDFSDSNRRRNYILNSNIFNESHSQKFYKRDLIERSKVKFAEGVSYEEPMFTYPLKFYVNRVAVTDLPLYYYIYNEQGTTAAYMSNPSRILEHLLVQQQVYDFMKSLSCYDEYKTEIELYIIHTFYVETFYFMKYRGYNVPVSLYRYMCKWIKENIPSSLQNPYLNDASLKEEKMLISFINEDVLVLQDEDVQPLLDEAISQIQI